MSARSRMLHGASVPMARRMLSSNICLHLPFIRYSVYNSNTSVYSVPLCWFVSTARTPTENRLCILHVRERHHEVSLSGRNASNEGYTLSLIHISEPTRLGMISYAVFCLKK